MKYEPREKIALWRDANYQHWTLTEMVRGIISQSGRWQKARCIYNNKIFQRNSSERYPHSTLKKYLRHRPEGIDELNLQPTDRPNENIRNKKFLLKRDSSGNIGRRPTPPVEKSGIQSLRDQSPENLGAHCMAMLMPVPSSPTAIKITEGNVWQTDRTSKILYNWIQQYGQGL